MGIYKRELATGYAERWALSRNPRYYDFDPLGGDCTNFVSQCLYAGCGVMNYARENGWFYINSDNRAPSWTGVNFLREFLLENKGAAVYGEEVPLSEIRRGDVIQLINSEGRFYHTVFVSAVLSPVTPENVFVCAHSDDARNRRLSTYGYFELFPIHIIGARREIFLS